MAYRRVWVPAVAVIAVIASTFLPLGGSAARGRSDVIATVSGHPIYRSDFERTWRATQLSYELKRRPMPAHGSDAEKQLRRSVLRKTVLTMILRLEAERLGIHISDAQIRARIAEIKQTVFKGDEGAYRADLRIKHRSETDLVADLRDQLVLAALLERAGQLARVTDREVRTEFERHRREYSIEEHRRIEFAVFPSRTDADEFKRSAERASTFPAQYADVRQATLARRSSLATSGASFVFALPTNRWSGPFLLRRMWYVIRPLSRVQPPRRLSLLEVRVSIERKLHREKARKIHRRLQQQAWRRYAATIQYRDAP